ncbi:uncharacterized protein LOC143469551 [Clavelina lepadiformis]|uniref:Uncharacterized protein n=1 Tax=Clavelina lepadiformis TaxID=159417 RepID=A0ABP0F6C0_CLALP
MNMTLKKVAWGIAIVGTIGVNIASITTQRVHRSREYCQLPFQALLKNEKAVDLLGGQPIKMKNINLAEAKFNPREAKLALPVRGADRSGLIYTMSTRPNKDADWDLQYAVMKIREGKYKWNVWLHPDGGGIDSNTDLLPDDVKDSVS